jgi:hypothetical protein
VFWLVAMALGLGLGLLTGGSADNFGRLRFRWPWLVIGAVVVREVVLLSPLDHVEGAQYLYALALAAIVIWTLLHLRRLRGIWIVTAGGGLNLLVILANGSRMPVAPELAASLAQHGEIGQYTVMGTGTHLNLLGDWIALRPLPEAYSPGDLVVAIGIAVVVFLATRRAHEHGSRIEGNPEPYSE